MFYSHQLLSRKGPMGQIWIAATIRANINRRKAATIDIEQICKQILYPPVPLALRLSGILMGGVVHVYNRKVYFLYEDLNAFLMKIKTEAARKAADQATLPSRKARAKFEKVTIDYGFEIFDDIERPMKQPVSPRDGDESLPGEQFFIFPNAGKVDFEDDSSPRDHFQAAIEDITLQENVHYSPQNVDDFQKGGSCTSSDNILGPMDDFLPEFQLPDNLPPNLSGALDTIFEEQLPEPEVNPEKTLTPEADKAPKRNTTARRGRKRRDRVELNDDDATEVPAKVFNTWLQDTSDIIGHAYLSKIARKNKLPVAAVQQTWTLPSVCVSLNAPFGPGPAWSLPLQEMWRLAISAPSNPVSEARSEQAHSGEAHSDVRETSLPSNPSEPDFRMETDNSPPEVDQPSLGSVEKLRAALQTPNTGSQEDVLGNKFGLRTPGLLAPLDASGKSFKRPKSTPHTGSLLYDSEGELPTSGRLKKRHSSSKGLRRSMSPISGELPELNFLPRRASGKAELVDYFASGDFQAGILAQSQLLEDTGGSTQAPMPADSINATTIVLAKHLREQFNKLEAAEVSEASLDKLTRGLDKSRAARMFYQVCVLASNESITVRQAQPYGDILLGRGLAL